ncbi:MAG TPA: MerR family transcriptional regulator [Microlunatus sp.]|nr:MerR family transcriptional regulator [Microlunatus sp.]
MRIGELAHRTGVSRRSLRYYEEHGLIRARRGENGWREYDATTVHRVRAIAELLDSGLTIDGVKDLAPCLDRLDPAHCEDLDLPLRTYHSRLAAVEQRLAHLEQTRDRLVGRLADLHAQRSA